MTMGNSSEKNIDFLEAKINASEIVYKFILLQFYTISASELIILILFALVSPNRSAFVNVTENYVLIKSKTIHFCINR
jgi:hypothetical protein